MALSTTLGTATTTTATAASPSSPCAATRCAALSTVQNHRLRRWMKCESGVQSLRHEMHRFTGTLEEELNVETACASGGGRAYFFCRLERTCLET
eukprot:3299703-Pleurochrysis_carterae.AAC.2